MYFLHGRQTLKNLKGYGRRSIFKPFKFFKVCLPCTKYILQVSLD